MATQPQVMSWIDPVTGLRTSGIAGYQSGSTGGINPTTMAQYLPPSGQQAPIPGMPAGSPYLTNPQGTAPDPDHPGQTLNYGLNPTQFATDPSAAALAKYLGGSVHQDTLGGQGNSWAPQNQVDVKGAPSPINAGLGIDTLSRYGSGATDYGSYEVNRDLGKTTPNQTYAQWALSNPAFKMNSQQSNSGPGYNMVWDPRTGTYSNAATGQKGMSQADTISSMQKFNGVTPGTSPSGGSPTPTGTGTPAPGGGRPGSPFTPPPGYIQNPTTGQLQQGPPGGKAITQVPGAPPNTTKLGPSGTITQLYKPSSRFRSPMPTDTPNTVPSTGGGKIDTTGLSVQADANGSYKGSVTVGGQPQNLAITPDGKVYDETGQDITSQFSQGDLSSLYSSFGQASGDPTYGQSMTQMASSLPPDTSGGNPPPTDYTGNPAPEGGQQPPPPNEEQPLQPPSGGQPPPPGPPPPGGQPPPTGNPGDPSTITPPPPSGGGGSTAPNANNQWNGLGLGAGNPYNYLGSGYTDYTGKYIPPGMAPGNPGLGNRPDSKYSSQDPYATGLDSQATNNREIALSQGSSIDQGLQNYINYNSGENMVAKDELNSAYTPIANGQGGYSDAEKASISNQPYLNSLQLTPGQEASNYLTPEEQAGIQGNPGGVMTQLGADESGMDTAFRDNSDQIHGALADQSTNVNNAVDKTGWGVHGATGQMYHDISGVMDATNPAVNNSIKQTADKVNPYIDPTALNASGDYMSNYNWTPGDTQDIMNLAGAQVGNQELSDEERLMQTANAQGNMSPMALASMRDKLRQRSAVSEAQAMTDARIKSKQNELNTTQGKENTRLGAAQNYANLGTGANLSLGQQNTSGQEYLGQLGLQGAATEGAANIGAEQYLGTQATEAQKYLGSSTLANQQQLNQQDQANQKFKTGTNVSAGETADQASSTRAASVAGNRQATNKSNQDEELARGEYIYGKTNTNNTNFANQRLQQEQEYRNFLQNKQGQANQNVSVGNQQRIGNYGTQMGAANTATGVGVQNYGTKPGDPTESSNLATGIVNNISKLTHGAKGGTSLGPHTALVGEAGRELLVDLAPIKHDAFGESPDTSDPYLGGSGETDTESQGLPSGTEVKRGQDVSHNSNPMYASILRSMVGQDPYSDQWKMPGSSPGYASGQQDPSGGSSGGGGGNLLKLIFGMAQGGTVAPGGGGHYYGSQSKLHKGMEALASAPRVEMINGPQIRTLGAKVPQAVIPLTHRKGNKVSIADLPSLMKKYGNYGKGMTT